MDSPSAAQCIAELEFKSSVLGVRLRRERIVVALDKVVYVYNFSDLQVLQQVETAPNPHGICALSVRDDIIVAAPGQHLGHVFVGHDQPVGAGVTISAHSGAIVALALSMDGSLLATASEKGTLVRVFNTASGRKLKEVRRGADTADIYSLNFSHDNTLLLVCSNKGTCHIFGLDEAGNRQSSCVLAHPLSFNLLFFFSSSSHTSILVQTEAAEGSPSCILCK